MSVRHCWIMVKPEMVATVEDADTERVFTNIYTTPAPTTTLATLEFTKRIDYRTLVDGEFKAPIVQNGQKKLIQNKPRWKSNI